MDRGKYIKKLSKGYIKGQITLTANEIEDIIKLLRGEDGQKD